MRHDGGTRSRARTTLKLCGHVLAVDDNEINQTVAEELLTELGLTVDVVGNGLDRPYPRAHASLWSEVIDRGVVISEWPPGTLPDAFRFPLRNRILAALSEVLVVVESRERDTLTFKAIDRITKVVSSAGGEVGKIDRWGRRRFAFEIAKQTEGYYVVAKFTADPSVIADLDRTLNLADEVVRHKVLVVPTTAVLYDGSPFAGRGRILFDYAEKERITHFGTSAKFIDALEKRGMAPIETHQIGRAHV